MAQPTIIWTFLPKGVDKGKLLFSAAVSFRLPESAGTNPNLTQFPEILKWPETLKPIAFSVELENGPTLPATRTTKDPDSDLWGAIFQPDAPVRPFRFTDLSAHPVLAYPARHVQTFLAQQYITTAAEHPEEPPTSEKVLQPGAFGQIRMKPVTRAGLAPLAAQQTEPALRLQVQKTLDTQKVKALPPEARPNPPQDFFLVRQFHAPRNKIVLDPVTKRPIPVRVPIKPPDIDFHQVLTLLGQYKELMRLLGLAIDFEMPIPPNFPRSGSIRIIPGERKDYLPWTRFMFEAPRQRFYAASRSPKPEVVDGFLDLADDDQYGIVQIDLDGGALKAADLSDQADKKDTAELPSLRSGGLSVVRAGAAAAIAESLRTAADNNAALDGRRAATFTAEDLVQGYRVDVWDDRSKSWHSLCKRHGVYSFKRLGRDVTLDDEGFVSASVTRAADGSSEDMYTHESVFCWEGWSLAAPRPGKTINPKDTPEEIQNSATTAFRLETKFTPAPLSLPRLRYGTGYRLRARAVDLAGNSLDPDVPDDSHAIPAPSGPPLVYSRFDPITPPVLVLREAVKRGESLDDVLIRSFNDAEPKDTQPTSEAAERHLAPPKTAELNAEVHGQFDTDKGLDPNAYALIVAKDGGAFHDVEAAETVELPYLPDPWAKGVTVRGLPHFLGLNPMQIAFDGDWPEKKLLRLRVVEGEAAPSWDPAARVLTVYLKKAEKATLRLSSYLNEDKVTHLGLYGWLEKPNLAIPKRLLGPARMAVVSPAAQPAQAKPAKVKAQPVQARPAQAKVAPVAAPGLIQLPAVDINLIRPSVVQGLHWMITPYRDVNIVHAVQQPIGRPAATKFEVRKALGDTFATFDAELAVHAWSSAKIDLMADWEEPVDNVQEPTWRTISGKAHVLDLPLARDLASLVLGPDKGYRHEFHDTKYRNVTYHAVATSRFREQMPKEIADDPAKITRTSDPIVIDVPNSAPPAMPKVLYVVPTFGWERKRDPSHLTSVRTGGGLRVYMERPWFSSGDGELLAAVLLSPSTLQPIVLAPAKPSAPAQAKPTPKTRVQPSGARMVPPKVAPKPVILPSVPEAYQPYVTRWGIDPLWRSGDTTHPEYPLAEEFMTAVKVMPNLTLREIPDVRQFTAVGHAVKFDEERGLWYADLEIAPKDAYYPFLRLALARFQPNSVAGAHLSRIILAEFIQLVPGRAVSVVFDRPGAAAKSLMVTVTGVSYIQTAAEGGPGVIEVNLESREAGVKSDLGWIAVPGSALSLTPQRVPNAAAGHFLWAGKINLPPRGTKSYRLVIREFERFDSDEVEKPSKPTLAAAPVLMKVGRLVFAEILEL